MHGSPYQVAQERNLVNTENIGKEESIITDDLYYETEFELSNQACGD
jgi:hypothetical protein